MASRLNFAGPALLRLTALAAQGTVRVFTTPVIRREVEAQIEELAEAGQGAASAFRAKATRLSGVPLPPEVRAWFDTAYDPAHVARHLTEAFHTFLRAARVVDVPLNHTDTAAVFGAYFDRRPPFGDGKKKSEFPDAFIVAALDGWCREHREQMYVVSADGVPGAGQPRSGSGGGEGERAPAPADPPARRTSGAPAPPLAAGADASSRAEARAAVPASTAARMTDGLVGACAQTTTLFPLARLEHFLDMVTEEEARLADRARAIERADPPDSLYGALRAERVEAARLWWQRSRVRVGDEITVRMLDLDYVSDTSDTEVRDIEILGVDVGNADVLDAHFESATLQAVATVEVQATQVGPLPTGGGLWDSEIGARVAPRGSYYTKWRQVVPVIVHVGFPDTEDLQSLPADVLAQNAELQGVELQVGPFVQIGGVDE